MIFVAQSVPCGDVLNADDGSDIARVARFQCPLVCRPGFGSGAKCAPCSCADCKPCRLSKACRNKHGRRQACRQTDRSRSLKASEQKCRCHLSALPSARACRGSCLSLAEYRAGSADNRPPHRPNLHAFILECRTGNDRHKLVAIVWRRMPAFSSSGVTGFSSRTTSATSSSRFEICSTRSP